MAERPDMTTHPPRKVYERKSLSCTECARRKLRCSKVIPCSACTERGKSHLCRRKQSEQRKVTAAGQARNSSRTRATPQAAPSSGLTPDAQASEHNDKDILSHQTTRLNALEVPAKNLVDGVANDFAVTLEFLALGRQQVLQLASNSQPDPSIVSAVETVPDVDKVVTKDQALFIMSYHQQNLTWTHNVVHLPTFRLQVRGLFDSHTLPDPCWLGLYYAMLSQSFYHLEPEILSEVGIVDSTNCARELHNKSIDALTASDFMSRHSLSAVQAICVLIYVGHNLGRSDQISVLLASAMRISQCLGLHRLGSSKSVPQEVGDDPHALVPYLIEREIKCRTWWFLVRQDWLQIPFNNTYTIHPSQFNTPMPKNCLDDFDSMVQSGGILEQDKDTYTECSYTSVLNKVSVLVWKTQDRMCSLGHPNRVQNGIRDIYGEVLLADSLLKEIIQEMPSFLREEVPSVQQDHHHVEQQRRALQLALAHKFFTLHRHFQVISFKDPWFTYTRVSCLGNARRSLQAIHALPQNEYTWIVRNLWTVNTHLVTAAVWIMFEQLFNGQDGNSLYDRGEMLDLVRKSCLLLQETQDRSQIARRGVRLIGFFLDMEQDIANGQRKRIDISNIIAYVQSESGFPGSPSPGLADIPCATSWMSQGASTWEALIEDMVSLEGLDPL
ncbi:hypothetical protein RBB50_012877 [Rhinocladiella similis]